MKNLLFVLMISLFTFSSCTQNKPVKTIADLKEGIKRESTASAKYTAFAQKATQEGKLSIAKLFNAASKAKAIYASNHRKALEALDEKMEDFTPQFEVNSTEQNLQAAIDGNI